MIGRRSFLSRTAGTLALPVAGLLVLTGNAHGDAAAPRRAAAAAPDLKGALLAVADLPAGFTRWTPQYQPYDSSSSPLCSRTLDSLDFSIPKQPGVRYASTAFTAGDLGPWVLETLRHYKSGSAKKELARVSGILGRCGEFRLEHTREKPVQTFVEKVRHVKFPSVATETWAGWITVTVLENGRYVASAQEFMVLARSGDVLMVLSRSGTTTPSAASLSTLARRAADKMRKLKL
ncbi:hypothetical protein [Sphaerisporangium fuscum]|uniref:hypothetical protein n=1 Tax=Sphaerisporangium fuscum TaxID=2835868 RepID=UPI001BDCA371|nr:hypothetical protein [Sphaerisporangium fuscum]